MEYGRYCIYIITNKNHTVLYIGVTGDLMRRIWEHREKCGGKFAIKYNLYKLLYFEQYPTPLSAISREKQLKHWSRWKKERLINKMNPEWRDLYEGLVRDGCWEGEG